MIKENPFSDFLVTVDLAEGDYFRDVIKFHKTCAVLGLLDNRY